MAITNFKAKSCNMIKSMLYIYCCMAKFDNGEKF